MAVLVTTARAEPALELPALSGEPSAALFKPYLGERFRVYGGQGNQGASLTEEVVLVEVRDAGSTDQFSQFTLRFRAEANSALRATTYTFEHVRGGAIRLFIEPARANADARFFESRFSLLKGFDPAKAPRRPERARGGR